MTMYRTLSTRQLYSFIRRRADRARDLAGRTSTDASRAAILEAAILAARQDIIDAKREIRRRRDLYRPAHYYRPYGDDCQVVEIITLPDHVRSRADAVDYVEDRVVIAPPRSPYDCTGEWFTARYHVGVIGGRWTCWHEVHVDC